MEISSDIRNLRRKSLLSQTDFAKAIGVSYSTVNRWENGKAIPNFQDLKKIKDFCIANRFPFEIDTKVWKESK